MKSSNLTAVEQMIKDIENMNTELMYLTKCNAIRLTEANHMDAQVRITLSTSDAVGSQLVALWRRIVQERKDIRIKQLLDTYNVTYDGE